MMVKSWFSTNPRITVVAGAAVMTLLAWTSFAQLWRGVIVSDAGDPGTNGYYVWDPRHQWYIKAKVPPGGWRVPNVYDLVSRGPDYWSNRTAPLYALLSVKNEANYSRDWFFTGPSGLGYLNRVGVSSYLDNTPPSTGWAVMTLINTTTAGIEPPPQVTVCGERVTPDPEPVETGSGSASSRFVTAGDRAAEKKLSEVPHVAGYPGTLLLLGINVIVAYYLWTNRVSPDAVAMSFTLFWEERQYWRLFTSSFTHFEPLHLTFNAFSTWNLRGFERLLGTFRFLCLTLTLVVITKMVGILIKYAIVKRKGVEGKPHQMSVGFSCVLFGYMTYAAVVMHKHCPLGKERFCFETWSAPFFGFDLPLNVGPFVSLAVTQVIVRKAGFLGHLSGILTGYLVAWGLLGGLTIPIVAGASVIFMIQHSHVWAHEISSFSQLLQDWSQGDARRVVRAWRLKLFFTIHACLTATILCLFSWSSGLSEIMALVVGYSAVQALKCCCWSDSQPAEHRICVKLLQGYGALSVILFVSDLLSFGAILGQTHFMELSGVSQSSQQRGLALLAIAAIVHASVVLGCAEAGAIFEDGQAFLSATGLSQVVAPCSFYTEDAGSSVVSLSGRSFPGAGRMLGAAGHPNGDTKSQ